MKFLLFALTFSLTAQAATIAVIDSGLDTKHSQLAGLVWSNPIEIDDARDNDGNGYPDDIHGWNFAESNNRLIDYQYQNTYTADAFKFFAIQGRLLLGLATSAEKEWLKAARENKELLANLQKFGNFVHGTHVAAIAAKGSTNQIIGLKLIPTDLEPFFERLQVQSKRNGLTEDFRMKLLKTTLSALAVQQMNLLEEIALYAANTKASIANGSFGTGFEQAKTITGLAFKIAFFRSATPAELEEVTLHFMNALLSEGQRMVKAAPQTLFVFAAGNDGADNDRFPTSPTNIKADNVISVAATYDIQFLASFSNYGAKLVDVAAPGVVVESAIPLERTLAVSGTSQASPWVANLAGQIKDANPLLTPREIKQILLGTVDYKAFLEGKVLSKGIVNVSRAVTAAQLSKVVGVSESINRSRQAVADAIPSRDIINPPSATPSVLPLAPMFQ